MNEVKPNHISLISKHVCETYIDMYTISYLYAGPLSGFFWARCDCQLIPEDLEHKKAKCFFENETVFMYSTLI